MLLKKSESRSKEKPRDAEREKERCHTRQKRKVRLLMGGKADDREEGNGKDIAENED